jgi:hypothetical protein
VYARLAGACTLTYASLRASYALPAFAAPVSAAPQGSLLFVTAEIRPIPVEDLDDRSAEWAPLELGYGQPPTMRQFRYDIVHDEVEVTGPIIIYDPPLRPAP